MERQRHCAGRTARRAACNRPAGRQALFEARMSTLCELMPTSQSPRVGLRKEKRLRRRQALPAHRSPTLQSRGLEEPILPASGESGYVSWAVPTARLWRVRATTGTPIPADCLSPRPPRRRRFTCAERVLIISRRKATPAARKQHAWGGRLQPSDSSFACRGAP